MARIVRWFAGNVALMLLSLLLAVIIWATAVRSGDPVVIELIQLPVEVVGAPADALIVSSLPDSVQVAISGPSSALAELTAADFRAVIDLSDVPFGENEAPIEVAFDHDLVEVISQFPESTVVRMEQLVTRQIPVVVDVRGDVARGHSRGDASVQPAVVQVTGASSRVDQLAEARVAVFLDNARTELAVLRRPTFYDRQGSVASVSGLAVNPDEVEIIIPVRELAGFAEKPITVDWVGEPAVGYRLLNVSVEPSSVLVTGRPTQLELLSRLTTEAMDISGLTETFRQQVTLDLPDGITQVETQPIFVTVEIEPILSSTVVRKTPELRALGDGLRAVLDPEEVRIFLFGPLPVLDSLGQEDVRVTLDLLNLPVGSHRVEPIVVVSANSVEVRSVQPEFVTVTITDVLTTTNTLTSTGYLPGAPPAAAATPPSAGGSSGGPAGMAAVWAAALPVALTPGRGPRQEAI